MSLIALCLTMLLSHLRKTMIDHTCRKFGNTSFRYSVTRIRSDTEYYASWMYCILSSSGIFQTNNELPGADLVVLQPFQAPRYGRKSTWNVLWNKRLIAKHQCLYSDTKKCIYLNFSRLQIFAEYSKELRINSSRMILLSPIRTSVL